MNVINHFKLSLKKDDLTLMRNLRIERLSKDECNFSENQKDFFRKFTVKSQTNEIVKRINF